MTAAQRNANNLSYHNRLTNGIEHRKAFAPYMTYTFRVGSVTMRCQRYDVTAHWATLFDTAYKVACTKWRERCGWKMEGTNRGTLRHGK